MRRIIIILSAFLFVVIAHSSYRNRPDVILNALAKQKLPVSPQRFKFNVYVFGALPIGEAVLEDKGLNTYKGRQLRYLSGRAYPTGLVAKVYPFLAVIDSYASPDDLLPVFFKQSIKSKDKEIIKDVYYNQSGHIMERDGVERSILPKTYDPLSLFLEFRNSDLGLMKEFDFNFNTNTKNYAFKGSVASETVNASFGACDLYTVSAKIFRRDKNPYHRSSVDIVFADNKLKLPLLIKVFASGMFLTVRLVEAR